jgi:penicillin-binding protein 1A
MAAAFAVFPNNGIYRNPRTYTRVETADGEVILENESVQEVAIKETTAYYMNSMLRSVVTTGGGTAANFDGGMAIAGKTGTTDNKYDRWFVGYTPYYTAAVWVGYKQPERVNISGNPALNMWKLVMSGLHSGLPDKQFRTPSGLKSVTVCKDSGLLATEYCKMDIRGDRLISDKVFAADVPSGYCDVHTKSATITVCVDDPVMGADGKTTGLYHLAGSYCPEESKKQVSLLDYDRKKLGNATTKDSSFMVSNAKGLETCTVHVKAPEPQVPDVNPDTPGGEGDAGNSGDVNGNVQGNSGDVGHGQAHGSGEHDDH